MKKSINLKTIFGFLYAIFGLYFLNLYFNFVDLSGIINSIASFPKIMNLIAGALLVISAFIVLRKKKDAYSLSK